jgi:hypothetical protein
MQHIILCEGKTDVILISYFLMAQYGWKYTQRRVITLPDNPENETLNWYLNPDRTMQALGIWGVGGIDEIPTKLQHIVDRTKNERNSSNRFSTIVLYFDRDTRNYDECLQLIKSWLGNCG